MILKMSLGGSCHIFKKSTLKFFDKMHPTINHDKQMIILFLYREMHLKHKKKNKKYTPEEALQYYKDMYEKQYKMAKEEHEKIVRDLEEKATDDIDKVEFEKMKKIKTNSECKVMSIIEAEKLWLSVNTAVLGGGPFSTMKDEEKINLIQADFGEFHKNYPIVTKYMVCNLQYDRRAFKKFLKLCEERLNNAPADRKKNYMEEQWIECRAHYVKYLWESQQKARYSREDAKKVYSHAYETILKDFNSFRDMHKKMEEKIKEESRRHKMELIKETADRIISGKQTLGVDETREFIRVLQDKKFEYNYKKVVEQLPDIVKYIPTYINGPGTNEEGRLAYDHELSQHNIKNKYMPSSIPQVIDSQDHV